VASSGSRDGAVARLLAPRTLVTVREPLPELPSDGLEARTLATAISTGTEVAAWTGAPPLRPTAAPYPRLNGYMNVAEVVRLGPTASGPAVGQRVYTHQSHRERFVIAADAVLAVVPETVSSVVAAPAYLYRLALSALRRGAFTAAHRVAVVGLGVIGLAVVELAVALGGEVAALSGRAAARAAAEACGAVATGVVAGDALARVWPDGADLVVTTSNRWADWRAALQLAGFNGRVVILGFPGRGQPMAPDNPLDSALVYDKQLSLVAAGTGIRPGRPKSDEAASLRADVQWLLDRIAEGRLQPDRRVAAVRPWTALAAVYAELEADAPAGVVVLDWT